MANARFLQIHTLRGFAGSLLNRDDSGLAKRMNYGGIPRTRISSQCLKRHWRVADDPRALDRVDDDKIGVRSREIVTRRVVGPLEGGSYSPGVIEAINSEFQVAVYGDKGDKRDGRQPLLLGEQEIRYLASEAKKIADSNRSDEKSAKKAAEAWRKQSKANMKALRNDCTLPAGIVAALFGRMVTSDVEANIDAPIHVAHAFTVHAEESESDYFSVVDDLRRAEDDAGADHIGETELTCGLFYGYVVVDRSGLINNLGGDTALAGNVIERLIHLIATVSPGAKLGSTAPYGYATWMLVEAGERQPRSLAEAFRKACDPSVEGAKSALEAHLEQLDRVYGCGEERRLACLGESGAPETRIVSFPELSNWAGTVIKGGTA